MITHDELTDMMAARLSKGEDLDLIYTNPKNHIVCFIPTYEPGGGDSTKCYFVDGREELVCLPMRIITRELALQEGLRDVYKRQSYNPQGYMIGSETLANTKVQIQEGSNLDHVYHLIW